MAIDSLLFIPPESEEERKFLNGVKLTYEIAYSILFSNLSAGIPLSLP